MRSGTQLICFVALAVGLAPQTHADEPPPEPTRLLRIEAAASPNAQTTTEPLSIDWAVTELDTNPHRYLIEARTSAPVAVPGINDFRLEIVAPGPQRQIPMLFGDRHSLAWPQDTTFRRLRINLDGPINPYHAVADAQEAAGDPVVRLHAQAPLRSGTTYRLTWRPQQDGSSESPSVVFQTGAPDGTQEVEPEPTLPERFYLAEILFRHEGILFLGQTISPPFHRHDSGIAAVGFSQRGRPFDPPNPGYQRVKRETLAFASADGVVMKPPLAEGTRYYGVRAERGRLISVRVSDQAVGLRPLAGHDDVVLSMHTGASPHYPAASAIFRVTQLRGNVDRLRQDRKHWQRRTALIAGEVLARGKSLDESGRERATIAAVLQDEQLLRETRDALRKWLKRPLEDVQGSAWRPIWNHVSVLLCLGDPADCDLLAQVAKHEILGRHLSYYSRLIAPRFGIPESSGILIPLLQRTDPARDPTQLVRLREVNNSMPPRLRSDELLTTCVRMLNRSPDEFGYQMVEARLLELAEELNLTALEQVRLRDVVRSDSGGNWYAPSTEIRHQAIDQLARLLNRVGSPEN